MSRKVLSPQVFINRLTSPATSTIEWCTFRGRPEDGRKYVFVFVDRLVVDDIIGKKCPVTTALDLVVFPPFLSVRSIVTSNVDRRMASQSFKQEIPKIRHRVLGSCLPYFETYAHRARGACEKER